MNDEPDGIRDFNPETSPDEEALNDIRDQGDAQNESIRSDKLDSDPEPESDELTVEPSAAELVSRDENQVDTTLSDGYSQVEELGGGNGPIMDQGKGAEDLSELPWWKRPFARLSKIKQKSAKGVDLTPSEELPKKILDNELGVDAVLKGQHENKEDDQLEQPWWDRIFGPVFMGTAEPHTEKLASSPELSDVEIEEPDIQTEDIESGEEPASMPEKDVSAVANEPDGSIEEGKTPKLSEEISPATPSITIDEVRFVVQYEISRIEADLSNLVQQEVDTKLAAYKPKTSGGMGLWATLLGLILISAVGVAGILLPRHTSPSPSFLVKMATMYRASGETEEAIRVLDEAVAAGISDTETQGQVGEMYRELKQYNQAIEIMTKLVEREPENESFRLSLARSYASEGQHKQAIQQLEKLIVIDPKNVTYYIEMGQSYQSKKDLDQALTQYQKAQVIKPNSWYLAYLQAEVYREMQEYDQAIIKYQKVLEGNPNHYNSLIHQGMNYADKRDYESAIKQYQAAMEIDPARAESYYNLGEAYQAQGLFANALEPYQKAIAANEQFILAYVSLGKVYVQLEDCENATFQFRTALKLDPKNTEAQQGLSTCASK